MIVGFAGSGNMSAGMARGWAAADDGPERMLFTDSGSGRARALAEEVGGEALGSNTELAEASDLLVLGFKPQGLKEAAPGAQGAPAVLSMLGATPVGRVAAAFPQSAAVRVMPNLGVELRQGVMCVSVADGVDPDAFGPVVALLEELGTVVIMEDGSIDLATAVMGCTPAYFALTVDALAGAAAAEGLDPGLARSLTVETLAATAALLRGRRPQELIDAVASPGGSTEAGLEALDREDVRAAFEAAVAASLARMRGTDA